MQEGIERNRVFRGSRFERADDELRKLKRDRAKSQERRKRGCRVAAERFMNLRERPSNDLQTRLRR